MQVDLFQFGTLLKNLTEGCQVALDCLIEAKAPSDFVLDIQHAYDSLESACCFYLECLSNVCSSGPDKKSELS